ncbi:heavy-metal-associated domain-containing protein [Trichococcus shcherbakoviae]|uniref:Heavy-metal-associated domain-containing protein n=1 Tax=Trichococcus shcherbakoviae subsp. psychrophilus TaxID=2585775 RepID=A0A5C5E9Z2_9LACT|nr:heavy metal-associated domain-containing protein [Trichococcus shcherbakoviae]TNV69979.1 heavy-metal-associated domain-containing protein [Trichococcus shcherbakoviae subsp. psychrophilus]
MEKELMLEGMKCDGCVATVKEKFSAIAGVEVVTVDLEGKKATVKTNQDISEVTFNEALSGTKFKVTGSK